MKQNTDHTRYENELEELRQQTGAPSGFLQEGFRQACERGPLDPKTAYLRMRWLLRPADPGQDAGQGIELLRRRPQLSAS